MVTGDGIEGRCLAFGRKIASGVAFVFAILASWMWLGGAANAQSPKVFFSSSAPFPSFPSSSSSSCSSHSGCVDQYDVNSANNTARSDWESHAFDSHDWARGIVAQRRLRINPRTGRPIAGFAAEVEPYDPIEALGYAKGGMVTKAPPAPAAVASSWYFAAWGQGSYDHEDRDVKFLGATISSRTTSITGLGGFDMLKIGITSDSDALVIGFMGLYTSTRTHLAPADSSRSSTPGGGVYASYINGGFSADFSFLANFTNTDGVAGGAAFTNHDTDSYVSSANVQYKYDMPNNWWYEPTIGLSHTRMYQDLHIAGLFLTDGQQWRFQAGMRAGTEWTYGAVKVQPTLTGLAYTDASVETPHPFGVAFVGPTDEHYVWGKGIGKVNVQWTDKFSTYVEGEVRGRADVFGYAGRVAARYTF